MNTTQNTNTIELEAHTNSSLDTPETAQFDKNELDALIQKYTNLIDWTAHSEIRSLEINCCPDAVFLEDGEEWESHEASKWEQTSVKADPSSLYIIFIHRNTGDELFFEYHQQ